MDHSNASIESQFDTTIPAHLFIGTPASAQKTAIALLQQQLCMRDGCQTCNSCRMIKELQHHAVMWFTPENSYTRDQFEPLFKQLSFELDTNEQFFFVIEKADFLTASCANSLLKSIEEPPAGYYFLLLAERLNGVVPTIRSRCVVHQLAIEASSYQMHPLFDFFTSSSFHDPDAFVKALDQSGISERESVELLDALLSHWIAVYRTAVLKNDTKSIQQSNRMVFYFSQAHTKQPMPGSSKLFWRNLFLSAKNI
ncbi:MAG TPA: hypothetical protein VI521_02415 [Candidatus Babeliales bacterium]|jgi:DNA polymerase-3 subunit delta'|nr:hypothetical protein [Candidatus Babeliales bacterium]